MSIKKGADPGPIGTKLGTFIVDENLQVLSKHVPINMYNEYLVQSINSGFKWLYKISETRSLDQRYTKSLEKFRDSIEHGYYTDSLNQEIIDTTHNLLSKIDNSSPIELRLSQEIKNLKGPRKGKNIAPMGPHNVEDMTDKDVDLTRALIVQTSTGKYELHLYVRHNDHYDILPYDYIIEKVKILPNLIYNGSKIN